MSDCLRRTDLSLAVIMLTLLGVVLFVCEQVSDSRSEVAIQRVVVEQASVVTNTLQQLEGAGQFTLGAYWGLQAVNEALLAKKNPTVPEILTRSQQLRAAAVLAPTTNTPPVPPRKKWLGIF